jgi:hypothetical protein
MLSSYRRSIVVPARSHYICNLLVCRGETTATRPNLGQSSPLTPVRDRRGANRSLRAAVTRQAPLISLPAPTASAAYVLASTPPTSSTVSRIRLAAPTKNIFLPSNNPLPSRIYTNVQIRVPPSIGPSPKSPPPTCLMKNLNPKHERSPQHHQTFLHNHLPPKPSTKKPPPPAP